MTLRPDAALTAFFVLWHYPFYVKIKGEETLCINIAMPQFILPASLSIFWQQINFSALSSDMSPIELLIATLKSNTHYFHMKFRTCLADILMFNVAKYQ